MKADYWVRTHLFAELDRVDSLPISMHRQGRLLALADSCRHEYAGSLDLLALSTISIAEAAVDWLVFGRGVGAELVAASKFDVELRCAPR